MEEIKQWVLHHVPDAELDEKLGMYYIWGRLRKEEERICFGIGINEQFAWEDAKNNIGELLEQPYNQ